MAEITYQFPPSALSALRMTAGEFAREMRTAACVQWYAQGILSQDKAADIAGLSRGEFLVETSRRGVPICQVGDAELEAEVEHIHAHHRRRFSTHPSGE